jgi:hypothetical protein
MRRRHPGRVLGWLAAGLLMVFRTSLVGVYAWSLTDYHIL